MRGRQRVMKKHIRQAGWIIAKEGPLGEGKYEMVLQGPRGEQMKVDAASRALAWRHAERVVEGSEPGRALWAR